MLFYKKIENTFFRVCVFDLIISNYIDHVVYIQSVHGLVKNEDKLSVYNMRTVYLAS